MASSYRWATWLLACTAGLTAPPAMAASFTTVYQFTGAADGAQPSQNLVQDSAGNLYGEAGFGAYVCPLTTGNYLPGCGTVFRIDPAGQETTLVTFNGQNGAFGLGNLSLIGNQLFGSAFESIASVYGLLFAVQTDGAHFAVLHRFSGFDGAKPREFLRRAPNGQIYGVTQAGGPDFNDPDGSGGNGVLYAVLPDGTFKIKHFFSGPDGAEPGRIVIDAAGTVYGATRTGGTCLSGNPVLKNTCGVVYSYVPSTNTFTVLHAFNGVTDGTGPMLGGIAADGTLYGATAGGVINNAEGYGTLFSIDASGLHTLYAFTGKADGAYPDEPPAVSPAGVVTGTAASVNLPKPASLYRYENATFTVLHTFPVVSGRSAYPFGTPLVTASGDIYGTTDQGGTGAPCYAGCGTVYRYSP